MPYEKFNPKVYKENLEVMIKIVLEANPDCAILLTVPNDCYYKRRYPNKNTERQRRVIIELAKKYNTVCGTSMVLWEARLLIYLERC